jgi:hypothetical protein
LTKPDAITNAALRQATPSELREWSNAGLVIVQMMPA